MSQKNLIPAAVMVTVTFTCICIGKSVIIVPMVFSYHHCVLTAQQLLFYEELCDLLRLNEA